MAQEAGDTIEIDFQEAVEEGMRIKLANLAYCGEKMIPTSAIIDILKMNRTDLANYEDFKEPNIHIDSKGNFIED